MVALKAWEVRLGAVIRDLSFWEDPPVRLSEIRLRRGLGQLELLARMRSDEIQNDAELVVRLLFDL